MNGKLMAVLAAAALLGACEARIGKEDETAAAGNEAVAAIEGTAEEGAFSIDAPGFEMKVRIPEGIQDNADINADTEIIPQGATFRGIHIQANEGDAPSGVELRFSDSRPPEELVGWYRSDEPNREFTVATIDRRGTGFVIAGQTKEDSDPFTVRLEPRAGGGSDGRVAIRDTSR